MALGYSHTYAPNPCLESMPQTKETNNAIMRYTKCALFAILGEPGKFSSDTLRESY